MKKRTKKVIRKYGKQIHCAQCGGGLVLSEIDLDLIAENLRIKQRKLLIDFYRNLSSSDLHCLDEIRRLGKSKSLVDAFLDDYI